MASDIGYNNLVRNLTKPGSDIAAAITAEDAHMLHMALGVSGECGELVDAIKKAVIYKKPLDLANVVEELGDLEFYLEGLRQALNITRGETLLANIEKLQARYSAGSYSDAQAAARADKTPSIYKSEN